MNVHGVTDLIDGIGCTGRETRSDRSHQKSDKVKGHWSHGIASSGRSNHKSYGQKTEQGYKIAYLFS